MASSLVTPHQHYTQNANLAHTLASTHRIPSFPVAYRDESALLRSILLKTFKKNKVPPYLREVFAACFTLVQDFPDPLLLDCKNYIASIPSNVDRPPVDKVGKRLCAHTPRHRTLSNIQENALEAKGQGWAQSQRCAQIQKP